MKQFELDIDNATLVEECKAGDKEAMSLLYRRFAPRMLHVISKYVVSKEDAQDILHDGFIVAFTSLDSIRDPESIDFWLASIMKNLSIRFLQSKNVSSILEDIPEDLEGNDQLDHIIDFETLETLIKQLPEGYQKVLRLAVLENKSHKEISKILGIAPKTSSSQLFHAKILLRQLVAEHRKNAAILTLLMLLLIGGALFIAKDEDILKNRENLISHATAILPEDSDDNHQNSIRLKETPTEATTIVQNKKVAIASEERPKASETNHPTEISYSSSPDETHLQLTELVAEKEEETAQDEKPKKDLLAHYSSDNDNFEIGIPRVESPHHSTWSASVAFDSGMLNFGGSAEDLADNIGDSTFPGVSLGPSDDDKDDENKDASELPNASKSPRRTRARESELPSDLRGWGCKHYLPITFGVSAEKRFSSRIGIETGLAYSYLHSDFEQGYREIACHWHYLEIPLKLNIYAYSSDRFSLYGSLGGRVSLPVYTIEEEKNKTQSSTEKRHSFDTKALWSASVSIGASYRVTKNLNIFIEPSLQYHFPQESKIPNIWTDDEPWSVSIPIGLRFSW